MFDAVARALAHDGLKPGVLAHKVWWYSLTLLSMLPLLLLSLPSCNATGMLCACARGLVVVAIVRHNRHVVRLRTRPYCCCHCAMRPACCALAHEALSSSLVWQRNRHVVRLRTRPCHCCHCATQPACRALAHKAISLSPSCLPTGMLCASTQGLIVVACLAM
jgi:hypothetical protein